MIIGKIDYINLAPFHVFLKRYISNSQVKQSINYHKSYPANINKKFKTRRVDAGFISSVESFRGSFKRYDLGIVAFKEVRSVLLKSGDKKSDVESASSNALANVLGVCGEVIIGDKALKLYLEDKNSYHDMCYLWYQKTKLPFVFARFCANKEFKYFDKLTKRFIKRPIKIPQYILKKYSKNSGIPCHDIKEYLELISYKIDAKGNMGLNRFKAKLN